MLFKAWLNISFHYLSVLGTFPDCSYPSSLTVGTRLFFEQGERCLRAKLLGKYPFCRTLHGRKRGPPFLLILDLETNAHVDFACSVSFLCVSDRVVRSKPRAIVSMLAHCLTSRK